MEHAEKKETMTTTIASDTSRGSTPDDQNVKEAALMPQACPSCGTNPTSAGAGQPPAWIYALGAWSPGSQESQSKRNLFRSSAGIRPHRQAGVAWCALQAREPLSRATDLLGYDDRRSRDLHPGTARPGGLEPAGGIVAPRAPALGPRLCHWRLRTYRASRNVQWPHGSACGIVPHLLIRPRYIDQSHTAARKYSREGVRTRRRRTF